jgi:hypothetical protein
MLILVRWMVNKQEESWNIDAFAVIYKQITTTQQSIITFIINTSFLGFANILSLSIAKID